MTPVIALYDDSLSFRLTFWAAVLMTAAAILQWLIAGTGGPQVVAVPAASVNAGAYTSPFSVAPLPPASSVAAPQVPQVPQVAERLAPPPRPELTDVKPDLSNASGMRPNAHSGLDDVIIDTTQNSRALAPRRHPELESSPQQ